MNADSASRSCIDDVTYNQAPVDLWPAVLAGNTSVQCCASHGPNPATSPAVIPGVSFSGFGYLALNTSQLRLPQTSTDVRIRFRSFSRDAVMFVAESRDAAMFYAIVLINGSLQVQASDGGNGRVVLVTERQHNDGAWYQVLVHVYIVWLE